MATPGPSGPRSPPPAACPQCGAAPPQAARVGAVYACGGCGNPVLGVAAPEPEPSVEVEAPAEASPPPRAWVFPVVAFVALLAAYVAVHAAVSASARRERDAILARWGEGVREAPEPPDEPAGGRGADLERWNQATEMRRDRGRLEKVESQIALVTTGLYGAFVLQTVLTAVLAVRAVQRAKRRARTQATGARGSRA